MRDREAEAMRSGVSRCQRMMQPRNPRKVRPTLAAEGQQINDTPSGGAVRPKMRPKAASFLRDVQLEWSGNGVENHHSDSEKRVSDRN